MVDVATDQAVLSHKERLLRAGMELFYENGFHGTSIDAVLATAGVPKGSFYHHFGSKDAFGQAVLKRYSQYQAALFDKWYARTNLSTADQLVGFYKDMSAIFVKSGFQNSCLLGKFSTEVAATSDVFRDQLNAQLSLLKSQVSALLTAGQERGDIRTDRSADELADAVLALVQGGFVLTLSTRDKHTLSSLGDTVRELIEPRV